MSSGGRKNRISYLDIELFCYHLRSIASGRADDWNVALSVRYLSHLSMIHQYTALTHCNNSTEETIGYAFNLPFYLLFGG